MNQLFYFGQLPLFYKVNNVVFVKGKATLMRYCKNQKGKPPL
jgi:hypothetical protein